MSTAVYEVADPASFSQPEMAGKLCGAWCRGAGDALASQAAGADFLVLRHLLSAADLASLCESVNVPVFAQGIGLEEAWELGATGIYAA